METTRIWPVLHVHPGFARETRESARLCAQAGVEGVFVIQMDGDDDYSEHISMELRASCPQLKIGINYLSRPPLEALERALARRLDATWADNPRLSSEGITDQARAIAARLTQAPGHLFFGSVAFKYQRPEPNPALAAVYAHRLGMIPTTSGAATGSAPEVEKLQNMRQALGPEARLGLASGVTPENAHLFIPYATDLLVATGISETFHLISQTRLTQLLEACGR